MCKQVFISHSSKDKPFVRKLVADLERHGILVWLDEKQINPGDPIPSSIGKGLQNSYYIVIVLSINSTNSNWVDFERDIALMGQLSRKNKKTIPILLDDCSIPEILYSLTYSDFRSNYEQGLLNLLRAFI